MTREEAENLLRGGLAGIKEFNHRRRAEAQLPDLSGADLSHAQMAGALLAGAQLSNADLRGADLSDADLEGADLIFAQLAGVNLRDSKMARSHLIAADLSAANLSGADLSHAQLIKCHISGSDMHRAKLVQADLSQADLSRTDLTGCDLSGALLVDADLTAAILRSANLEQAAVMGVKYQRGKLICRGIRADSCYGHAVLKRDLQDTDWIETFRAQSRRNHLIWVIWSLFTDCGRSLLRVWLTATVLAMAFGTLYSFCPSTLNMTRAVDSHWTPFYYSFVTFTTLGFGDVTPGNLAGEIIVTVEVVLGYLTLGILVSILANKVARRS